MNGYKKIIIEDSSTTNTALCVMINHKNKIVKQTVISYESMQNFLGRIPAIEEIFTLPYLVSGIECKLI